MFIELNIEYVFFKCWIVYILFENIVHEANWFLFFKLINNAIKLGGPKTWEVQMSL